MLYRGTLSAKYNDPKKYSYGIGIICCKKSSASVIMEGGSSRAGELLGKKSAQTDMKRNTYTHCSSQCSGLGSGVDRHSAGRSRYDGRLHVGLRLCRQRQLRRMITEVYSQVVYWRLHSRGRKPARDGNLWRILLEAKVTYGISPSR